MMPSASTKASKELKEILGGKYASLSFGETRYDVSILPEDSQPLVVLIHGGIRLSTYKNFLPNVLRIREKKEEERFESHELVA